MEAPSSGSRYVAIGTGTAHAERVFEVLVSDDLVQLALGRRCAGAAARLRR